MKSKSRSTSAPLQPIAFSTMRARLFILLISLLLLAIGSGEQPLYAQSSQNEYMEAGKKALDQELYEEALDYFTAAIELDPEDAFAYGYRGNTLWYLERFADAIEDFNEAVELNPDYSGAFLLRGRTYYRMEEYDRALVDLSRAIALDREYDYAFAVRSEVYVDLEQYEKALADLNRAIELVPDYTWAFAKRADVHRILGQYDLALEDASRSLELSPDYDWAYAVRGNTYQEMEAYEDAVADFSRAIEIDPDYAWALAQRASAYQDLGEYRKAIADYTAAIEIDPKYDWALAGRGKTYQQLEEYAKSVADFNRAIRLDRNYEWAIAQRGLTYLYMEEFEKAIEDFDRAIELAPEDGWNFAQRADARQNLERYEEALADFNRSIELDPEYAWALAGRGELLAKLERFDEALADLDRALSLSPDSEWIYEIRGQVHQTLGNTELAVADFNRAAGIEAEVTPAPSPTPAATAVPRGQAIRRIFGQEIAEEDENLSEEPADEKILDTPDSEAASPVDSYLNAQPAIVQIEATGSYENPYEGVQINQAGRGSGVIIDPSGIAVTNAHVVMGSAILNVYLAGETRARNARILGVDPCRDLAVIQVSGDDFPFLDWYEGTARTGMSVYAAGFPLGDPEFTLMSGIVARSRTDGNTPFSALDEVIMHDATILPGNSGGPLLSEDGRIVGINYMGNSRLDRYYAIPHDVAKEVTAQLQNGVDINNIGVNGEVLITDEGEPLGIWVSSVDSGSPAARTGIRAGDIIYALEGIRLAADDTLTTYCKILRSHDEAEVMTVALYRPSTDLEMEGELNGEKLTPISTSASASNPKDNAASKPEPESSPSADTETTAVALGCDADTDPDFADYVILSDEFTSDENNWAGEFESETLNSVNVLRDGKLVRESSFLDGAVGYTRITDTRLTDFWFCILAQVTAAEIKDNGIVFLFRADNSYESYYSISFSGYGDYMIQSKVAGEWEILQEWTVDPLIDLSPGVTNRFDIIGNGPLLTFAVNDEIIAEIEDSRISEGGEIAFGTFGSAETTMTVAFDDLVVLSFDDETEEPPAAVAVVNVPTLNVRQGPGVGYSIIGTLNRNARVVALGRANASCSWILIELPGGEKGWISGNAQFVTLEGDCARLSQEDEALQPGDGTGRRSGATAQGCIFFENHFGSEANITLSRPSDGWNKTWKIGGKAKHTECMPAGRYTYTVDVPPPWGSINGEFVMGAGERHNFPIYGE